MSLAKRNDGCYECCKRRLKCDKTEPECLKCQKKGITCSGQGIRCRFSNHMSSNAPRSAAASTEQSSTKKLRWVDAGSRVRKGRQRRFTQGELKGNGYETLPGDSDDHLPSPLSDHGQLTLWSPPNEALLPQERMLFSHFSNQVAPIMVVLDSISNGYRDIILPLACQDQVLGRAVSVVSAFHLAQQAPHMRAAAEAGHHAIVEKLRRDSMQLEPAQLFNPYTLATVLVLLVGETITGTDNYMYLLEMLACLTQCPDAVAALPAGLREFFQQQVKMFQLFGFPLANESKGLEILAGSPDRYLDFMSYPDLAPWSETYSTMDVIREAIRFACNIYRRRAESSLTRDESIHIVEQMRQKVAGLSSSTQGAHALVWVYFIAAAESILLEHRDFFTERLVSLYDVTGFGSIPAALGALKNIWRLQGVRRWTEVVVSETPVLIM